MAKKSAAAKRIGGPGASHENKKEPSKSKPQAKLNKFQPKQRNTKRTAQGKSGGDGRTHSQSFPKGLRGR